MAAKLQSEKDEEKLKEIRSKYIPRVVVDENKHKSKMVGLDLNMRPTALQYK